MLFFVSCVYSMGQRLPGNLRARHCGPNRPCWGWIVCWNPSSPRPAALLKNQISKQTSYQTTRRKSQQRQAPSLKRVPQVALILVCCDRLFINILSVLIATHVVYVVSRRGTTTGNVLGVIPGKPISHDG